MDGDVLAAADEFAVDLINVLNRIADALERIAKATERT